MLPRWGLELALGPSGLKGAREVGVGGGRHGYSLFLTDNKLESLDSSSLFAVFANNSWDALPQQVSFKLWAFLGFRVHLAFWLFTYYTISSSLGG